MKGVLLLNGEPFEGDICADEALVVCCDGAYGWARDKVRIDINLGDYDSLPYTPQPPPERVYPSEKDLTDGEIAVERLLEAGVDTIEIYGGGGKREDHFLGNLHLLYKAHIAGATAEMINNNSRIFLGFDRVELGKFKGRTISVLPFGGALHIIDSTGLKYAEPPCISYGQCIGISNVVLSGDASVTVAAGDCALIIVNGGEV